MRSLSIFTLLVASASFASANVITFNCTLSGGGTVATYAAGGGASQTYSCSGFSAPALSQITSIALAGFGDFTQGALPGPDSIQVVYSAIPAAFANASITATASGSVSNGFFVGSQTSTFGQTSVPGVPLATFAAFNVTSTSSVTQGSVGASSGSLLIAYTYEVIPTGTPEPSTLALVGGVLVLAGLRKFRS